MNKIKSNVLYGHYLKLNIELSDQYWVLRILGVPTTQKLESRSRLIEKIRWQDKLYQ